MCVDRIFVCSRTLFVVPEPSIPLHIPTAFSKSFQNPNYLSIQSIHLSSHPIKRTRTKKSIYQSFFHSFARFYFYRHAMIFTPVLSIIFNFILVRITFASARVYFVSHRSDPPRPYRLVVPEVNDDTSSIFNIVVKLESPVSVCALSKWWWYLRFCYSSSMILYIYIYILAIIKALPSPVAPSPLDLKGDGGVFLPPIFKRLYRSELIKDYSSRTASVP